MAVHALIQSVHAGSSVLCRLLHMLQGLILKRNMALHYLQRHCIFIQSADAQDEPSFFLKNSTLASRLVDSARLIVEGCKAADFFSKASIHVSSLHRLIDPNP